MIRPAVIWAPVALLLLVSGVAQAGPGEDPRAWLEQMSTAMNQLSYQGTFVYMQGDNVETVRITHVSDEDGVRERMVSLSGEPSEVLRDSNGVRWVQGDGLSVLEDSAFNRSFFPRMSEGQSDSASQSYSLKFGKDARIAGHPARNVKVLPRDVYRYGYSLWLEKHSGLLLKWELVDSDRNPLAKLVFTDIKMGSQVDPGELKPGKRKDEYKTVASDLPVGQVGATKAPRWQPSRLPPGFQLSDHRYSKPGNGHGTYEHLVYSDGLATVSVYVENLKRAPFPGARLERHGTTHAYTHSRGDVLITVIGDVPAATVKQIGQAVAPVSR